VDSIAFRIDVNAWDCFLYSGYLFILTVENELRVYDWDRLIQQYTTPQTHLALNVALLRGDFVFSGEWKTAYHPNVFFRALRHSIRAAATAEHQIDQRTLENFLVVQNANASPDLADCITIYNNALYLGTEGGLFEKSFSLKKGIRIDAHRKVWDGVAVDLVGGGIRSVAIAAASDGAFQYHIPYPYEYLGNEGQATAISKRHTTSIDWSGLSMYRTSTIEGGELIARLAFRAKNKPEHEETIAELSLDDIEHYDYSWGAYDKVFGIRENTLHVFEYSPQRMRNLYRQRGAGAITSQELLKPRRTIGLQAWKGDVVGAGVSAFGAIIECDNALVVVKSADDILTIREPFARWRTYNRSKRYQNQLHIVNERDLYILAFTDDFFISDNEERVTAVRRVVS
jgi:hypothetical protein